MGKTHRTYTPEFKVRVVMELISGKKSLGEASREYSIKDSVISRWRQEFMERARRSLSSLERKMGRQSGSRGSFRRMSERRGRVGRRSRVT